MNYNQKLVASDIIARDITKIAIVDKIINERIYNAIIKKEFTQYTKLSENFYIYGFLCILIVSFFLIILGEYREVFYYISGFSMLAIFLVPIFDNLLKKYFNRRIFRKIIGQKKKTIDKLLQYKQDFPEVYTITEKAFEVANEDGAIDNFIAMFYSDFLTEMLIETDNPILKENIKRVSFSIAHGTFIVESLDLENLTDNQTYLEGLTKVLDAFEYIIKRQEFAENELSFFKDKYPKIQNSISDMKIIIQKIKEFKDDKVLARNLTKQSEKLRKIVEKEPISKGKIKEIRLPAGMKKDQTLTAISVIDEDIIEVRTRAGNYYVSKKYFDHEIIQERRMFKLLTDKELEIKIKVLNSTLEVLEENKEDLTKKEYEAIKTDYIAQLFASEQLLEKRKGKGKSIVCPYCSAKNPSVLRKCKKCGEELPYCIICLNSIGKGIEISVCPHCASFAHKNHFAAWLEKTNICPYCKKKIKKELKTTILESLTKVENKSN
ncbi:MAG: zinc ribbon domain-containing protein [Candidatus Heimdallarchaeota archaeon]